MSITKDFEGSYHKAHLFRDTALVVTAQRVEALLAHTRALEAMLKKYEYVDGICLECDFAEPGHGFTHEGHRPDCALAKLLEGVE